MDEEKIEELRLMHHDLAKFLGDQHELLLSHMLVIAALRKTLEGSSTLAKKYAENLASIKSDASALPSPTQLGVAQTLLRKLRSW